MGGRGLMISVFPESKATALNGFIRHYPKHQENKFRQ